MAEVKKNVSYITELFNFGHNTIIDCKYKLKNIFTKEISNSDIAVYGEYDIIVFYRHDSRKKSNYEVRTVTRTFAEIIDCGNVFKENSTEKFNNVSFNAKCRVNEKDKHHSSSVSYEVEVLGDIKLSFNVEKNDAIVDGKRADFKEKIDLQEKDNKLQKEISSKRNVDSKEDFNSKDKVNSKGDSNLRKENKIKKEEVKQQKQELKLQKEKNKDIKEHNETSKDESEYLDVKEDDEYSIEQLMNMGIEELRKIANKK